MRSILILLALAGTAFAQHFPEHVPDFSDDPKAVYVRDGETLEIDGLKCVSTLVVEHGGTLILWPGTDIVILDQPFHPADTAEIGNGLIVMGDVLCMGSPKTPFVRSVSGIPAGATSATFDTPPQGWLPGDKLTIPDTRQRVNPSPYDSHTEIVTITQVCGGTVEFTPTQYDHPVGTHEWMTPHVANLTRDVVIRSENPDGIRGHIMVMGGTGEWGYAEIRDMGRTDGMEYIGDGNTNGRYPLHWHLMGDGGANQHAEGLVVNGSKKWCYTVHGTSGVTLDGCIGIGAVGGTFVTENGLERNNTFRECMAINARSGKGRGSPLPVKTDVGVDIARDGSGFWMAIPSQHIIDCVAADCDARGFSYNGIHLEKPVYDQRPSDAGTFRGNETYASGDAVWIRSHSGGTNRADQSRYAMLHIEDSRGWNLYATGAYIYRTSAVTVDNCHFYADSLVSALNEGNHQYGEATVFKHVSAGFQSEAAYPVGGVIVRDSSCEGFNIGIQLPGRVWRNLGDNLPRGVTYENMDVSAGCYVIVSPQANDEPQVVNATFTPMDIPLPPPLPQGRIIMSTEGLLLWDRVDDYHIEINGERYYYPDDPGPGREERNGVIGFVGTQE